MEYILVEIFGYLHTYHLIINFTSDSRTLKVELKDHNYTVQLDR